MVCKHMDDNILGIDLINDLGMSFDTNTQQVFAISKVPDSLVAIGQTTIQPFSTAIVHAPYTGHLDPQTIPVVTILSTQNRHLQGGPAIVKFNYQKVCQLEVTNTAPYEVTIGQNEFICALDQWTGTDQPIPLREEMVKKFISKVETKVQKFLREPSRSS